MTSGPLNHKGRIIINQAIENWVKLVDFGRKPFEISREIVIIKNLSQCRKIFPQEAEKSKRKCVVHTFRKEC